MPNSWHVKHHHKVLRLQEPGVLQAKQRRDAANQNERRTTAQTRSNPPQKRPTRAGATAFHFGSVVVGGETAAGDARAEDLGEAGFRYTRCSLSPVPKPTDPSGITQQLVMRSLERALERLSIERLKEQTITIEIFSQVGPTVPTVLIREFVTAWLRAHGVRIVEGMADLKVKFFAGVLGTDSDQDLFGIPAFYAPIVNVPVPEVAFYKWQRNHGVAELRLFEFDGKTDEFVAAPPIAIGRAKLDKYTILIFFGYTSTDVDDHE